MKCFLLVLSKNKDGCILMNKAGKIMNLTHMQQRIDTAENWTNDNPVLFEGEIGYESQPQNDGKVQFPKEKVGDGKTSWNDLPYSDRNEGGFKTYVASTVSIGAGEEHVFTYPTSEKILTQVYEVSNGSTHDNRNVAFDVSGNYDQQDSTKTSVCDGKLQLRDTTNDLIPIMTSNTTPYGACSASGCFIPSVDAFRAFDGLKDSGNSDLWINNGGSTGWLSYKFPTAQYINKYTIISGQAIDLSRSPKDWTFEGSNDGSTWTILDTQTNQTSWTAAQSRSFSFNNSNAYLNYRLNISANNGSNYTVVIELQMFNSNTTNSTYYTSTTSASNYSLAGVNTINSLIVPVTIPTNTSVKILASFDGRKSWLYHDIIGWHEYTETLSEEWKTSNSNTELQSYFTGITITQLASDLGYTPQSIDFIFQLGTGDPTVTPVVSALIMNYTVVGGLECADVGSYDDTCSRYGLKITSPTQLSVKNKDTASHTISIDIIPLNNVTYLN